MYRHFRITSWLVGLATFGLGVLISSAFTAWRVPSSDDVRAIQTVRHENIAAPLEPKTCLPPAPRTFCILTEESILLQDKILQSEKRLMKVRSRSGIYAGMSEKQLESLQHELDDKLRVLRERGRKLGERYVGRQQTHNGLKGNEICNER